MLGEDLSPYKLECLINSETALSRVELHVHQHFFFDPSILHHFDAGCESEELEPGRHLEEDKECEEQNEHSQNSDEK